MRDGLGQLIVSRRPQVTTIVKPKEYLPCEFCLEFFARNYLYLHASACPHKDPNSIEKNYLRNGEALIYIKTEEMDADLHNFFLRMKETKNNPGVMDICKSDKLICEFAKSKLERLGDERDKRLKDNDNVRTKVRTLGRLLIQLNKNETKEEEKDLSSYITGKYFSKVVDAVKALAASTDSPNIALALGHYLKQVCLLKVSVGIQNDNEKMQNESNQFKALYDAHWNSKVTHIANRRSKLRQINKPAQLPLAQDLVNFNSFLKEKISTCIKEEHPDYQSWRETAQLILTWLTLFNRRRISEVQELTIGDFTLRQSDDIDIDIKKCLDTTERALAER